MTLVDQHVTVLRDAVVDLAATHQALDHRDVEAPVEPGAPAAEGANRPQVEAEEAGELRDPLVPQGFAMNEHQRVASAGGDEIRADDGLPAAGRRHEDPGVVGGQRAHRLLLCGRELPMEPDVEHTADVAAILDPKGRAVLPDETRERVQAPTRKLRGGGDAPRSTR